VITAQKGGGLSVQAAEVTVDMIVSRSNANNAEL
jgi:hypothetical protein